MYATSTRPDLELTGPRRCVLLKVRAAPRRATLFSKVSGESGHWFLVEGVARWMFN